MKEQRGSLRRAAVAAIIGAATLALHAADGVWNRIDNTNVVSPALWSDAANWTDNVIAGGEGNLAAFTNVYPNAVYRAVEIPPEGVTLGRFWFKNYAGSTPTVNGAYLLVSGGPMRMEGPTPRLDSSADQLWILSDIQGTNGLTSFPSYSVNLWANSSYTGLTTLETGYWITHFEGVADTADPVIRDYAATNDYVLTGGRLSFYGRPATTATITSNWSLVEGQPLITHVSGTQGGNLVPGTPVSGSGIAEGTFVKRIVNGTNLQLSPAPTSTASAVSLVFSPLASECYQSIRSVDSRHSNSEFILNKNSAKVLRVEVGELKGSQPVAQRVSPGHPSGVLSIRNARSFGGTYTLRDAWLELVKDGANQPVLSNVAVMGAATIDIPEADATASVPSLGGATNTLTKSGAGRLAAGLGFGSTLSFVVEAGALELPRPQPEPLLAEASLRLDASRADTLTLDGDGRVSRWADANGRANAVTNPVSATQPVRVSGALNGLPVVDFGPYFGSAAGCGLFLEARKTGVRSAFIVYYGRTPDSVIFGEAPGIGSCAYTRSANSANAVWSANTADAVKLGTTDLDGIKVVGTATELPTNQFHLVSVVTTGDTTVGALGNDRNYRSGGQQIAEVILFDRALTLSEQATVDAYLMDKWFGVTLSRQAVGLTLKSGTRLTLPFEETLVVSNLTLSGEVWLEGPGQVLVAGGLSQSGTVHFVNGGGLAAANVGGTLEAPSPAVASSPSFWVDACALTNAGAPGVVVENGTNFVTRWNDVRGSGYNFATNITLRPVLRTNDVNGLPSVQFRRINAVPSLSEALFWDQPMNDIRAVFMVVGSQEGGGILLGSSAAQNTADFYRGAWVDYGRPIFNASGTGAAAALLNGLFYLNGAPVNPTITGYNGYFQLVEAYPTGPVRASAFAGDRNTSNGNGCQRICEMILFNRALSEKERLDTAEYLMRKWLGRGVARATAMAGVATVAADGSGTLGVATTNDYLSVTRYTGSGDVVKTGKGTLVLSSLAIAGKTLDVQAGTLVLKAGDPAERVPTDAFLHVDAAAAGSFSNVVVNGTNFVEEWHHSDGGAVFAKMRNTAARPRPYVVTNALNGLPVVDFGPLISSPPNPVQCFLELSVACSNLLDAFAVIGSQDGGNTIFGTKSSSPRPFWRANNTAAAPLLNAGYAPLALRVGETRVNGVSVEPTVAGLSGGYDLVAFSAYAGGAVYVDALANDAYTRTGGQKLGEVLIYNRALTLQERRDIEAYLMKKWFGVEMPGYEATVVGSLAVASGARVEVDGVLAVDGLSGSGTVAGDLALNAGAVITVEAAAGTLSGLTVEGGVSLAGGGMVVLAGDPASLATGLYTVLTCSSLSGQAAFAGQWAVAGVPAKYAASLSSDGTHLFVRLSAKGTMISVH